MTLEQDSTEKVLCDPYIYTHNAAERLYSEYKKYGSIIIAFDFDYTVHNFKDEQWHYDGVINLLRAWQPYAKLVVFTASAEERYPYIEKYLRDNDIPFDYINEDILPPEKHTPARKIYYNILLDDRAGLGNAFSILREVYNRLEAEGELKTWRK